VIAEIVSDVRERLPEVEVPQSIDDPDSARFRLFDSITTFLKTASDGKPLILILDDLHWADKPSLMLLEFLARELTSSRIFLVGTYRDGELTRRHPLSATLGELGRERLFERIVLKGIGRRDVARFIEIAAGVTPPIELVDSIFRQTEGNPLFVTETVRLFVQEGELTPEKLASSDSWTVRVPEGVRDAIGRRLDRLSERAIDVLTTAAVIGRQFTLTQLEVVVQEISEDRLLDVLDEALGARVLEELPDEVGRYQFTHALTQQALAEELSAARKVRLHARIAEELERLYGDDADSHAAQLATTLDRPGLFLATAS
jgi:predicted ATPase